MLLDFEVQRSTRRCAATQRTLEPGETCYSVLEIQGADIVRKDYCHEAWTSAPDGAFGWWKTRIPEPTAKKVKLAPNEVLLQLFDEMADLHDQQDLRYVLTLLLVRRRVLRLDLPVGEIGSHSARSDSEAAVETMFVYCPQRDTTYEVPVAMPAAERIDEIQQRLSELLVADGQ
ncbi:MAG TPA: hypothetical protein VHK01_04895 [Lacipirellulaceae bacterium]|jgi:hypothetical protein|nr:hypothetical protein [Lacipirellulaceae bacterium]